jgi:hypothetical protein
VNDRTAIAVRYGKNGKTWQAEQVYGGLFFPGPDPAELRAWVADDTELGRRVAADFLGTGRCLCGALDQHFFEVQLRKFPDPGDAPKRRAGLGRACLCQDDSHYRALGSDHGRVHCGLPAGTPLNGLFWTAHITVHLRDAKVAANATPPRRGMRHPRRRAGQTG